MAAALRSLALASLAHVLNDTRPAAVAFQGALGHGIADALSDIDVVVAYDGPEPPKGAPAGELVVNDRNWSVFQLCFDRVDPKRWKDKQRWVYAYETSIVEDASGRLRRLCDAAALGRDEQVERITYLVKKIGNRGITYMGTLDREWRGIHWGDRPDLWVRRGDLFAAHMRLSQAFELLVDLLFALNGRPVPSPKRKHHLVRRMPWVPVGLESRLRTAASPVAFDEATFEIRRSVLVSLLTECVDHADQLGALPLDAGAFYFPRFSGHSDNTQ